MKKIFPILISGFLILVCLTAGIWMLVSGGRTMLEENRLKKAYASVEGNLSDYALQSEGGYDAVRRRHSSATYRLTYTYFVDNVPYTVTTDYSTGDVPALGDPRTVYYDPTDPGSAILGGVSSGGILLFGGFFFTAIPLIFILVFCAAMGWLPKTRINVMDLVVGGVTASIGGGFTLLMEGGFHPLKLIPWLLIAAGLWVMVRGLLPAGGQTEED